MEIKEFLKKFTKKHVENLLIEHGTERVQETFDQTDGVEAYDEAAKTAIKIIKKHPELAPEFLDNIKENVSPTVAVNTVIQLPEEDVVSEETAVIAIKKLDLEDEKKIKIIEESSFGYENKIEIAEQLEDEETRENMYQALVDKEEERALSKLNKIYEMCDEEMNEAMLQEQLKKAMEDIHIETDAIKEKRGRIVAKKIAYNYARIGTTILTNLRFIMLPKEMNEINIVQLVKEEHKKILMERDNIKGKKIIPFDEKKIEELGKQIDNEIEDTAKFEEDNGEYSEKVAFKEFEVNMRKFRYNPRKILMKKINEVIQNEKMMKTYEDLNKSGIVQILSELTDEERKRAIDIYADVLGKRINEKQQSKEVLEVSTGTDNSDISGTPSEGR